MSLKRLHQHVFTELWIKLLLSARVYKSTSSGKKHAHTSVTKMAGKEPEPWSPRWLRQQHREDNNDLQPNDPNHDRRPPADAERPLCKCDLDCTPLMSLEHDTYDMRY
jgi:hypothetical protein